MRQDIRGSVRVGTPAVTHLRDSDSFWHGQICHLLFKVLGRIRHQNIRSVKLRENAKDIITSNCDLSMSLAVFLCHIEYEGAQTAYESLASLLH